MYTYGLSTHERFQGAFLVSEIVGDGGATRLKVPVGFHVFFIRKRCILAPGFSLSQQIVSPVNIRHFPYLHGKNSKHV